MPAVAMQWLELPALKWAIPLPVLAVVAPLVWRVFRGTWRELDEAALAARRDLAVARAVDYRPVLALTLCALVLTWHEYYGKPDFYLRVVHGALARYGDRHPGGWIDVGRYDELYMRSWWGLTRIAGYLLPLAVWPLFFRGDQLLDFGLRSRGFRAHAWIYAACLVVMVPLLFVVSRQSDFADYYPMYKLAGRSWLDFGLWEIVYIGQFFTLEVFFRGFLLRALRTFGAAAIWVMVVPYCMVHYGKPYLEACAAIVAGVVLGSLAMQTRSIYAGFLVHGTIAVLMDVLALSRRGQLPARLTPDSPRRLIFQHWLAVVWVAWVIAIAVLALKLWRRWRLRLEARARASPAGPRA